MTKRATVEKIARELNTDFQAKDISILAEVTLPLAHTYLSRLQKEGKLVRKQKGTYSWKASPTAPSLPSLPKDEEKVSVNLKLAELTTSFDWLTKYVKQLEDENRSLYEALCRCGNFASETRKRYEDRLHAIKLCNEKRRKEEE